MEENTNVLQTPRNTLGKTIKSKTMTIYPKSIAIVLVIFVQIYYQYLQGGSYIDEGMSIAGIIVLLLSIPKMSRGDKITMGLIVFYTAVGLFSNILFNINDSVFSVLLDALTQAKPMITIFSLKYFLSRKEKQAVADMMLPFAKLYFLVASVCAIISLFKNIGMSNSERYGLPAFNFFFRLNLHYTSISFLFIGVIIASQNLTEKKRRFYIIIAIFSILAALKSPALLFSFMFVFLTFYFKKYERISLKILIFFFIAFLLMGTYQIQTYILDVNAPRRLFIDYSIKTANTYFPFGSGFGTFGSAEAAKHYSPLYYQYGFDNHWGMDPLWPKFMSDTYWPMAIGQFGYIGAIAFVAVYVRIFMMIVTSKSNSTLKAYHYALFLQMMIQSIGTSIFPNSAGLISLMGLAIFSFPEDIAKATKKKKRAKIKITM